MSRKIFIVSLFLTSLSFAQTNIKDILGGKLFENIAPVYPYTHLYFNEDVTAFKMVSASGLPVVLWKGECEFIEYSEYTKLKEPNVIRAGFIKMHNVTFGNGSVTNMDFEGHIIFVGDSNNFVIISGVIEDKDKLLEIVSNIKDYTSESFREMADIPLRIKKIL